MKFDLGAYVTLFKAEPTEYARITSGGKVKEAGLGISRIIFPFQSTVELVDTTNMEGPLRFSQRSSDRQDVTVQGSFIYTVADPEKVLSGYNFSVDPRSKDYLGEGKIDLQSQMSRVVQASVRRLVESSKLDTLLGMTDELAAAVEEALNSSKFPRECGINIVSSYVSNVTPSSEIARALGAEYRESVLTSQASAEYARRESALGHERTIAEMEVANRIAVAEKETDLVEREGSLALARAEYAAKAATLELGVYEGRNVELIRAIALHRIAQGDIGHLTITPSLLAGLEGRLHVE